MRTECRRLTFSLYEVTSDSQFTSSVLHPLEVTWSPSHLCALQPPPPISLPPTLLAPKGIYPQIALTLCCPISLGAGKPRRQYCPAQQPAGPSALPGPPGPLLCQVLPFSCSCLERPAQESVGLRVQAGLQGPGGDWRHHPQGVPWPFQLRSLPPFSPAWAGLFPSAWARPVSNDSHPRIPTSPLGASSALLIDLTVKKFFPATQR